MSHVIILKKDMSITFVLLLSYPNKFMEEKCSKVQTHYVSFF